MSDKLSRADILAMEAGDPLDRLLAEHVMGWRYSVVYDVLIGKDSGEPWAPSFNLVQAWRIVETMLANGYEISLANRQDCEGYNYWGVDFYVMIDEAALDAYFTADAPTVELAICRAALFATLEDA